MEDKLKVEERVKEQGVRETMTKKMDTRKVKRRLISARSIMFHSTFGPTKSKYTSASSV